METPQLRLFRITCLGASSSGKTSLVNAFVNGCFPIRTQPTEHAAVFHRRLEVHDADTAAAAEPRAYLVEVEDTPGSERAMDLEACGEDDGPLRKGMLAKVSDDSCKVIRAFKHHPSLTYRPEVEHAIGRRGTVAHVRQDGGGVVALTMRDGTVFELPLDVVDRSAAMELPIDEFLHFGERPRHRAASAQEQAAYEKNLLRPFAAHARPMGNPMMDRTITKRRMGFFICFDLSDDTGESVKEALALYRMLYKRIEKDMGKTVLPIIWLVGCKADRRGTMSVFQSNEQVARSFSEDAEIPFHCTSARTFQGVQDLFRDMVLAILERQQLWSVSQVDGGDARAEQPEGGYCQTQ